MKKSIKKSVVRRLNLIRGQTKGLSDMVEHERYCIDIITQAEAIKQALSAVENLLLKNHLETHVVAQIRGGKRKQAVEEILKVYNISRRK